MNHIVDHLLSDECTTEYLRTLMDLHAYTASKVAQYLLEKQNLKALRKYTSYIPEFHIFPEVVKSNSTVTLEWWLSTEDGVTIGHICALVYEGVYTGSLAVVGWCYQWYRARAMTSEGRFNPEHFPSSAWELAAHNGNIEVLKWLEDHEIPPTCETDSCNCYTWANSVLVSALVGGEDILKYVVSLGLVYDPTLYGYCHDNSEVLPLDLQVVEEYVDQLNNDYCKYDMVWGLVYRKHKFRLDWLLENHIKLIISEAIYSTYYISEVLVDKGY